MNDVVNTEELSEVVKSKTLLELCREIVFWDRKESKGDLKIIAWELYTRKKRSSITVFFFIALLTNSTVWFFDAAYGFRWVLFEDNFKDIIRQYIVCFLFLGVIPFAIWLSGFLDRRMGGKWIIAAVLIYGLALIFGLIKTLFDTKFILQLLRKFSTVQ